MPGPAGEYVTHPIPIFNKAVGTIKGEEANLIDISVTEQEKMVDCGWPHFLYGIWDLAQEAY